MSHFPDRWIIVKVGDDFAVFGSWYGGFANGNSWRLSSNIKKFVESGDSVIFITESNSEYICNTLDEGYSNLSLRVISSFHETHGIQLEPTTLEDFKNNWSASK